MDFTLTEGQRDLARLTGEVCAKLVTADRLRELDRAAVRFDEQLWRSLAETGVLAAALPEAVGGSDLGPLEQTWVLRELGKYVAAVPYLWSIALGAGTLARVGSPEQRGLATKAAAGETILTVALSEERNWEPARPTTTATADGDGWTLTGTKTAVPFAAQASRILVPATVSGAAAVFLVDPARPGVRVRPQQVVDRGPEAELEFDRAPAELVGTVESGARLLDSLLSTAWLGLAAQQLGTLERALDLVAEYAREREQFGRKIGGFQAVAQRLADGYIDLQGLRLTVTQAAWRLSEGLPAAAEIHTAKFWAADAGHRLSHTVVHIHGGVGIDRDHIVHAYFTAAKHNEFALGGATDHLRAIGELFAEDASAV
ncbi:acyl-CoA/acyl-ACP dehydrogenase [Nocardia terpenica]|uniref:acyl-CoA dehydrogenase family protein n=1 Tax=Nocardia terpenica TaxID=455432 RepID=UPI00189609D2|nr:acyl-CoA dehydrogenase family protein [Nocardia terpenica]MBF6062335.1 acyl-CoA/acyl-ACP dehydrogenase [Nocardia terpenica]MBF6104423.1 acyl-CoA/acyl-ACP dehydrogenase [Nocardia terpenica]MBF6109721.1 acyl-CoA/acyl-ACP dehydrogenase [Nocardia terpenica]MBF6120027.1 acyl-CoA/acyl-ACP dehydrogenase [Nocardia terpenica]MBF6152438.1 acyl-CoA/acyl-ACP dehydrogenase [Nocardia terpenica]